jgi:hypothetical protein
VEMRHTMAAEGEREFVFHTPGWAALRERERAADGRPQSLVELDARVTATPENPQDGLTSTGHRSDEVRT